MIFKKSSLGLNQLRSIVEGTTVTFGEQFQKFLAYVEDYRKLAKQCLESGAVWDGGGTGAVQTLYSQMMRLEQQLDSVVIGELQQLLQEIGTSDNSRSAVVEFATKRELNPVEVARSVMADLIRKLIVDAIDEMNDSYEVDFGKPGCDEEKLLSAQQALRNALKFPL